MNLYARYERIFELIKLKKIKVIMFFADNILYKRKKKKM